MEKLDFQPLAQAIDRLAEGLDHVKTRPADDVVRDGVIQRFEYTMDLSWKFIQRYLKAVAGIDAAAIRTKKDLFREAARLGLIADAEAWIYHYEARAESSHSYHAQVAQSVFERTKIFLPDSRDFLKTLRNAVA